MEAVLEDSSALPARLAERLERDAMRFGLEKGVVWNLMLEAQRAKKGAYCEFLAFLHFCMLAFSFSMR